LASVTPGLKWAPLRIHRQNVSTNSARPSPAPAPITVANAGASTPMPATIRKPVPMASPTHAATLSSRCGRQNLDMVAAALDIVGRINYDCNGAAAHPFYTAWPSPRRTTHGISRRARSHTSGMPAYA
jgi:hypothetical protein